MQCKAEDLARKEQFINEAFQLVQVNLSGYNRPYEKHGNKHICTAPGYLLTYAGMEDSENEIGRKITIYQEDKEETHTSLFWQIEHNGSWHYEICDQNTHFYVCVSGPTEVQSHWFKNLAPGESFESVPVAVGVADDSFEKAMGELTKYRRMIRRPNKIEDAEFVGCEFKKWYLL